MMLAGEDPEFVMRRLLILAGEDIGLADPNGIVVVTACANAVQYVGLPEAKYHLALATTYLATAPKSNSMTQYFEAERVIQEERAVLVFAAWFYLAGRNVVGKHQKRQVPVHLRDASYKRAARLGHGKGYQYPHSYEGHWVAQQYLPDIHKDRRFYNPSDQGYEAEVKARVEKWRATGEE